MHSAMEQTRYWVWSRRKLSRTPLLSCSIPRVAAASSSYNESWEEQAFAEDSAGPLGGCIWPPRSYSCSFCSREFRSAQALGGHMNVHRCDRARLKQSSSPNSENHDDHHHLHLNPSEQTMGAQFPPQLGTVLYNPNPDSGVVAPPLSPSAASPREMCSENTLISPPYFSSILREHRPKESFLSTPPPLTDSITYPILTVPELKLRREELRLLEVSRRAKRDLGKDTDGGNRGKRRRTDPTYPFFVRSSSGDRGLLQSEVLNLSPSPIEELDLELRLGDPPKIYK